MSFPPFFLRLSGALLVSTALGSMALAQSLPEISPETIAQDVERRTDPRTGDVEYIAGSFDPFESDPLLAGSAALRTSSGATAINGQYVNGGAFLDISTIYTSNSADSFDVRGFEAARFHSGQPINVVRYDRKTLDCARNTSVISYDHSYDRGASYGYLAGLYRLYPRYRGHRHFGWNQGSWNRNVFGGRYIDYDDFRRQGARRIFRDNRNGLDRHNRDRDRGDRRHRDRDEASRPDRNRDRARDRNRHVDRGLEDRNRVRDRSETRDRRNNRDENSRRRNRDLNQDGNIPPRRERRGATPRIDTQTENNAGRNRDSRPANINRWRRGGESSGSPSPNTRSGAARNTAPRQTDAAPAPRQARANRPVRADSPPASRPARISNPRANRQERKSRPAVNRAVDQSFKRNNRSPKSKGQKVRRFYPGGYVREDVSVSYRCVKEEKLTLHIPQERIDAARFDGFAVMLIDNNGQEVPVFIPPNYVEGFRKAAGFSGPQSQTYPSQNQIPPGRYIQPQPQPLPQASSRTPIIYGNLD